MFRKRFVLYGSILLILLAGASAFAGTLAGGGNFVRILIGGKEILQPEDARIVDGRTLAPIRPIAESLGAEVRWDNDTRTVHITKDQFKDEKWNYDMRISLLEQALSPKSPDEAVVKWADGVKMRNGALQFAVMSEELREQKLEDFSSLRWVTGTSSPWIEQYEITEQSQTSDGSWQYKVKFALKTSTGDAGLTVAEVLVKQHENVWLIDQISEEHLPPEADVSHLAGTVKEIHNSGRPRFLFEGAPMSNGEPLLIWLSVNEDTKICIVEAPEPGAELDEGTQAQFADLKVGQKVRVNIEGPILESYPAQGTVSAIWILK